jgi:hypothetical protein
MVVRPLSMSWQEKEQVLDMVADQPGIINTRALTRRHGLPKTTVHTCLQRYSLYPYRPQQVQALQPGNRRHRLQYAYCMRLVQKANEDAGFVTRVLRTGESHFTQMGIVNTTYITGLTNTRILRAIQRQVCWSLNMWAGLLGDCIIGPYLLRERFTPVTY